MEFLIDKKQQLTNAQTDSNDKSKTDAQGNILSGNENEMILKDMNKGKQLYKRLYKEIPYLFDSLSQMVSDTDPKSVSQVSKDNKKKNTNMEETLEHKMFNNDISAAFDSDIVNSPAKRRKILKTDVSSQLIVTDISDLLKQKEQEISIENFYRLFGITFFPLVDPADVKIDKENKKAAIGREMLGIRLEILNKTKSIFEKPHYILLKKRQKSINWLLFKYTIPNYIDIESSFNRNGQNMIISDTDIFRFAKDMYSQLQLINDKHQYFLNLQSREIINNLDLDLIVSQVSFNFMDYKIELVIDDNIISSSSLEPLDTLDPLDANLKSRAESLLDGVYTILEKKLELVGLL